MTVKTLEVKEVEVKGFNDIKVVDMLEGEKYYIKDDLSMCDIYEATKTGNEITIEAMWLEGDNYVTGKEHMLLINEGKITIEVNEYLLGELKEDEERSYHVAEETKLEDITLNTVYLYAT